MSLVEFTREEKALIVEKLQKYFESELNQEIGQFDAEFLMDFFSEQIVIIITVDYWMQEW